MSQDEIFGGFASVHIHFLGTINQLALQLALKLNIPEFEVASNEYPPYDLIASGEVLGWEIWLKSVVASDEGNFLLQIETEGAVDEILHGRMHNLSPWFARLIGVLCELKATPASKI